MKSSIHPRIKSYVVDIAGGLAERCHDVGKAERDEVVRVAGNCLQGLKWYSFGVGELWRWTD